MLLRRFPAHQDLILRLLDAPAPTFVESPVIAEPAPQAAPVEPDTEEWSDEALVFPNLEDTDELVDSFELDASTFSSPAIEVDPAPQAISERASQPIAADHLEVGPVCLLERRDSHGVFERWSDGLWTYTLTRDRLRGRNPATEFLHRAQRIADAAVEGIQTPEIQDRGQEGVVIRFRPVQSAPVTMITARLSRRGSQRRLFDMVLRIASRLDLLHVRGGAHGRLSWSSLCSDPETDKWTLGTGFESGPGLDAGSLEEQKANDIRCLGAMLYIALADMGSVTTVAEVVARFEANSLVSLSGRRPELHPSVPRLVERALGAGKQPQAFQTITGFRTQLKRLVNLETGSDALVPAARPKSQLSRWLLVVPVLGLLMWGLISTNSQGNSGRLAVGSEVHEQVIEELREAIQTGNVESALRKLNQLKRKLGLRAEERIESSDSPLPKDR
jgi:hypothetical protein